MNFQVIRRKILYGFKKSEIRLQENEEKEIVELLDDLYENDIPFGFKHIKNKIDGVSQFKRYRFRTFYKDFLHILLEFWKLKSRMTDGRYDEASQIATQLYPRRNELFFDILENEFNYLYEFLITYNQLKTNNNLEELKERVQAFDNIKESGIDEFFIMMSEHIKGMVYHVIALKEIVFNLNYDQSTYYTEKAISCSQKLIDYFDDDDDETVVFLHKAVLHNYRAWKLMYFALFRFSKLELEEVINLAYETSEESEKALGYYIKSNIISHEMKVAIGTHKTFLAVSEVLIKLCILTTCALKNNHLPKDKISKNIINEIQDGIVLIKDYKSKIEIDSRFLDLLISTINNVFVPLMPLLNSRVLENSDSLLEKLEEKDENKNITTQLLESGKILEAIDWLLNDREDIDELNDLVILKAQFLEVEKKYNLGLILHDESQKEKTRIMRALLNILK